MFSGSLGKLPNYLKIVLLFQFLYFLLFSLFKFYWLISPGLCSTVIDTVDAPDLFLFFFFSWLISNLIRNAPNITTLSTILALGNMLHFLFSWVFLSGNTFWKLFFFVLKIIMWLLLLHVHNNRFPDTESFLHSRNESHLAMVHNLSVFKCLI